MASDTKNKEIVTMASDIKILAGVRKFWNNGIIKSEILK